MSKSVENIFDTFCQVFDVAPFRRPLLQSADRRGAEDISQFFFGSEKRTKQQLHDCLHRKAVPLLAEEFRRLVQIHQVEQDDGDSIVDDGFAKH